MKLFCKECNLTFEGRGNAKYCSRLCTTRNEYAAKMLKPEWRLSKLLSMAKNRSKEKDIPFNLDLEFLTRLWNENQGCCSLLGIPLELGRSEKGKVHPYAPSIDRIIPKNGYVKDNIRIIAYQLNVAFSEFGMDQFDELVTLYQENKRSI